MGPQAEKPKKRTTPNKRDRCGAQKPNGTPCKMPAGFGTEHLGYGACKFHYGSTQSHNETAARTQILEMSRDIVDEHHIEPSEAIIWAVRLAAGAVQYWRDLIRQFDAVEEHDENWHLQRQHAFEQYAEERDRMTKTAFTAVRAGVAERQIQLAERQGQMLAEVLDATLRHLGLDETRIIEARRYAIDQIAQLPEAS